MSDAAAAHRRTGDRTIRERLERMSAEQRMALLSRLQGRDLQKAPEAPRARAIEQVRGERHEPFPLTDVQEAYWVGRRKGFDDGEVSTHGYMEIDCETLDVDRLEEAWNRLVLRHDMLRAVISEDGTQHVLPSAPRYRIERVDARIDADAAEAAILATRTALSHQTFDPATWPLFDVRATLTGPREGVRLHLSFDVIVIDAWSLDLMSRELERLYREPGTDELADLTISFREYVLDQRRRESEDLGRQRARDYWLERLPTLPPAPALPLASGETEKETPTRFTRRAFRLSQTEWTRLQSDCRRFGVTPSAVILTAYASVLGHWSGENRFTLNMTLFDRSPIHPQVEDIVGDFTSLLLLEVDLEPSATFIDRAKGVQKQLWRDMDHRQFSGIRVMREMVQRQAGTAPITSMPVVFTSVLGQRGSAVPFTWLGEEVYTITQTPQVWLDNQVAEDRGELVVEWDSVDEVFPAGMLDDMFAAYSTLLRSLASSSDGWSGRMPSLTPEHDLELVREANATRRATSERLLHDRFAERVRETPDAIALIGGERQMRYAELDELANRVARLLVSRGAGRGERIGIVLDKGPWQIVAVLGVVKAGAAYVPIDPHLPDTRRWTLLEQAELSLALCERASLDRLTWPGWITPLALDERALSAFPDTAPETDADPGDLAYVIFTSGSTGLPKGVMIDHRGASNTIDDVNERLGVGATDRVLGVSALNFDLSVYDIFGLLSVGGTIVLPPADARLDTAGWRELVDLHHVTLWNSVPALFELLVESVGEEETSALGSLRHVMLSGDWIPVDLPERCRARLPNARILGMGGATEASIWSICHPIENVSPRWRSIPYGRAMSNQTVRVVDERLECTPRWTSGEIVIGGVGLALGYWRDAEKTSTSFVNDPLSGERLYRTGDLGRLMPSGDIEFLGRRDFQAKVQGHRIELGEIESALLRHEAVASSVVVVSGERFGAKRLVAYVVAQDGKANATHDQEGLIVDPLLKLEFCLGRPGLRGDLRGRDAALPDGSRSVESLRRGAHCQTQLSALRDEPDLARATWRAAVELARDRARRAKPLPVRLGRWSVPGSDLCLHQAQSRRRHGGGSPLLPSRGPPARVGEHECPHRYGPARRVQPPRLRGVRLHALPGRSARCDLAGLRHRLGRVLRAGVRRDVPASRTGCGRDRHRVVPGGRPGVREDPPLVRSRREPSLPARLDGRTTPRRSGGRVSASRAVGYRRVGSRGHVDPPPSRQVAALHDSRLDRPSRCASPLSERKGRPGSAAGRVTRAVLRRAYPHRTILEHREDDRDCLVRGARSRQGRNRRQLLRPGGELGPHGQSSQPASHAAAERHEHRADVLQLSEHPLVGQPSRRRRRRRDGRGRREWQGVGQTTQDGAPGTTPNQVSMQQRGHGPMSESERVSDGAVEEERIAVVGMSGRFAGAASTAQFWANLRDGVESMSTLSDEDMREYYRSLDPLSAKYAARQAKKPGYVRAGYFLDDPEMFDAAFFGFNPSEIELVDPQHRLFLETCWEAFEDAGYDPLTFDGRVGVYAGTLLSRYMLFNIFSNREVLYSERDFVAGVGNEVDYLPTRVSYKLNLRGPSVSVQTACSTSLVAIHLGCQSLLDGECDMALAGASMLQVPARQGYLFQEGSMVSPDGHCRAFDAAAKGTVFANGGSGSVLLKRLSDALADGDNVYAVVRGSAINNDGSSKVGFTAPSLDGQVAVITEALEVADVSPRSVSYVEAHGTGTPIGDPIELEALTRAYRGFTDDKGYCAIGSVKPNIGHTTAAAGVASFMKVALAIRHAELPPSLNYATPNPQIDFDESPFYVNTALSDWTGIDGIRRAGVSSFGVGGTNAHVILEQASSPPDSGVGKAWQILNLSGQSADALTAQIDRMIAFLETDENVSLPDLAYTLHVGRHPLEHRFGCAFRDRDEALSALRGATPKLSVSARPLAERCRAVFMFSGQGSQYVNMARELYEHERSFRDEIDRCDEMLSAHTGWRLVEMLYPEPGEEDGAAAMLARTDITQPALFVIEYALGKRLIDWGVSPSAMIGHSIGEWVCACLAGVIELEDALRVVALRGELMHRQPSGSMIAVRAGEARVRELLPDGCALAAINGTEFCTVSGPHQAIDALLALDDLPTQALHTSHAFHSAMMDPVLAPFTEMLSEVTLRPPEIPYVSNVTGTWITDEEATDPGYWARHLRNTVRFADGVATLTEEAGAVLVEVGPGTTLSGLARPLLEGTRAVSMHCLPHPKDALPAMGSLYAAIARIWAAGVQPDWRAFYAGQHRRRVSAPTYPFQRRRHWIEANQDASGLSGALDDEKQPLEQWFDVPGWSRSLVPLPDEAGARAIVVLHRASDFDRLLLERLRAAGHRVTDVRCSKGTAFEIDGERCHADPTDASQLESLFERLHADGRLPERIVHSLTVRDASLENASLPFDAVMDEGFWSLVALAQAIGTQCADAPLKLHVLTSGLADVTGRETMLPEQAALLGPCRVIPLEYPHLRCGVVDIDSGEVSAGEVAMDALLDELDADPEPFVAYRNARRWSLGYEPVRLPEPDPGSLPRLVKAGGVYLITGGLGGLGLVHARQLARLAPVKLVLLGRTAMPTRERWNELLDDRSTDGGAQERIRRVKELESLGAEVSTMAVDITDEAGLRDAIERVRDELGALDGIVHCAGVAGGGLVQLKSREMAEPVFAAKVRGALALERATADMPLDFVLLCSSLFAVSGGVGQVDYCGANNVLDALARAGRFAHARTVVSIDWDAWSEVGMARGMLDRLSGVGPAEDDRWERIDGDRSPRAPAERRTRYPLSRQAGSGTRLGPARPPHRRQTDRPRYVLPRDGASGVRERASRIERAARGHVLHAADAGRAAPRRRGTSVARSGRERRSVRRREPAG